MCKFLGYFKGKEKNNIIEECLFREFKGLIKFKKLFFLVNKKLFIFKRYF